MRKLLLTTAAVAAAIAGAFADETAFGTITDKRDGQTYRTVTIGRQTWMAQNLNYRTDSSWCYDGDNSYCKKFGRLYNWDAARKACPSGWHLPSRQEWNELAVAAGGSDFAGKKLKAKNGGWRDESGRPYNGTDNYGFSALPAGDRDLGGNFHPDGYSGYWWTATKHNHIDDLYGASAYHREIYYQTAWVSDNKQYTAFGLSVRCIKDGGGKPSEAEIQKRKEEERRKEVELRKKETDSTIEKLSTYFTDPRDGRSYRAVEIGGKKWMAHNLNYETPGGSWCYDNNISNCTKYGRLYNWKTATTACPAGWHLPTRGEWDSLMLAVGGKMMKDRYDYFNWVGALDKLKAKRGWYNAGDLIDGNGTDDYGFSALPGGGRNSDGGNEGSILYDGFWWTASEKMKHLAYERYMSYAGSRVTEGSSLKNKAFSVRCVQNSDGKPLDLAMWKKIEEQRVKEDEQKKKEEERWQKEAEERIKRISVYFTDTRDGNKYRAVKIGAKTWMAENLNYQTPSGSSCGGKADSNCVKYGRLYNWETATAVCPSGWHLPSEKEWDDLVATVGGKMHYITGPTATNRVWNGAGKKLKAASGWKWNEDVDKSGNGTDDYGFSALPGGSTPFGGIGEHGYWWTTRPGYRRVIGYFSDSFVEDDCHPDLRLSVRCVQDDS